MPLLNVPVLIGPAGLNLPAVHAIMPQQRFVAFLEIGEFGQVVDGGGHAVQSVDSFDSSRRRRYHKPGFLELLCAISVRHRPERSFDQQHGSLIF